MRPGQARVLRAAGGGTTSFTVRSHCNLPASSPPRRRLQRGSPCHRLPFLVPTPPCCSWDAPLSVARAPGRLDVMGGIADYSGSLVLQMPISEAAHVALQLQGERPGVEEDHTWSAQGCLSDRVWRCLRCRARWLLARCVHGGCGHGVS